MKLNYKQDILAKLKLNDILNIPDIVKLKHIKKCGIYFLVLDGKIMYVGQSIDIFSRIKSHTDKEFTDVYYLEVPEKDLDKIERKYIIDCAAPYNKTWDCEIELIKFRELVVLLKDSNKVASEFNKWYRDVGLYKRTL